MKDNEYGQLHIFNKTLPISSYLFALAAGPYTSFKNEDKFKVPMSIYCRRSKAKNADA